MDEKLALCTYLHAYGFERKKASHFIPFVSNDVFDLSMTNCLQFTCYMCL